MPHTFNDDLSKPHKNFRSPQIHPSKISIHNQPTVSQDFFSHKDQIKNLSSDSQVNFNLNSDLMIKLKSKIKQMKAALKTAEQHNEDLHMRLYQQKKQYSEKRQNFQTETKKYKELYNQLLKDYQSKSLELKEVKRKLKKLKKNQSLICLNCQMKNSSEMTTQINQQTLNKYKQIITKQQVTLQHIQHQNHVLCSQIIIKNQKISEYQTLLEFYKLEQKTHQIPLRTNKNIIDLNKMDLFQQDSLRFSKNNELTKTKIQRLEVQLEQIKQMMDLTQKQKIKFQNQNQQLKMDIQSKKKIIKDLQIHQENQLKWKAIYEETNLKYNEILKFSYQIQKDFEKELNTMAKQMARRELIKNSSNL